jgi:hypothetical protein
MAKDDFHVIVYQILAYLYQCLKRGDDVNPKLLSADSDYFKVNEQVLSKRYWAYIIYNLYQLRLIEGVVFADIDNFSYKYPVNLDDCMITPAGIEYLTDNAFITKAKEFLKDVKAIVPFV